MILVGYLNVIPKKCIFLKAINMIIAIHNYITLKDMCIVFGTAYYQRMYIYTDVYSVHVIQMYTVYIHVYRYTCIQMSIFVH